MKIKVILISFIILILLSGSAFATPTLFGKVANDGSLIGLYYNDLLGNTIIIDNNSFIPVNKINVAIYSPFTNGQITFTVEQYQLQKVKEHFVNGNTSYNETVTMPYNIVYDNQSIPIAQHSIVFSTLDIPTTNLTENVVISYDGISFSFYHHTAPILLPSVIQNGSLLSIYLFATLVTSIDLIISTLIASAILRKIKYSPPISLSGWMLILLLSSMSIFFFIAGFSYQFIYYIGFIQWYYYLIPLTFLFILIMLDILPKDVELWDLIRIYSSDRRNKINLKQKKIMIARHSQYNYILVKKKSRIDAIKRLLGIVTPVIFESEPIWYAENELCTDKMRHTKRIYFLPYNKDISTTETKEIIEKTEKNEGKFRKLKPNKIKKYYFIPVSNNYMQNVAEFLSNLKNVTDISKKAEENEFKLAEIKSKLDVAYQKFDRVDVASQFMTIAMTEHYISAEQEEKVMDTLKKEVKDNDGKIGN